MTYKCLICGASIYSLEDVAIHIKDEHKEYLRYYPLEKWISEEKENEDDEP